VVTSGLVITIIGVIGFVIGVFVIDSLRQPAGGRPIRLAIRDSGEEHTLLILGTMFFVIVYPIASRLPSGASLSTAGAYMVISGICLLFLKAKLEHRVMKWGQFFGASVVIPMATLMAWGFLGQAITALIVVTAFVIQFWRPQRRWVLALIPLLWLALSFYVTYMEARKSIRDVVWSNSGYATRVEHIVREFSDFKFFDPTDIADLHWIDMRLNQNVLVGQAVEYMGAGFVPFAKGETLVLAAVAWIPRAIWIGKPVTAGSGNIVAKYTGRDFAFGTSIGVGPILELYLNFGSWGVFVGMAVVGGALRFVDTEAANYLYGGNVWRFARYHILGMTLVHPQGNFAEIVGGLAGAFVLLFGCERSGISRLRFGKYSSPRAQPNQFLQSGERTRIKQ
jgi:hypothetical protein